MNETRNPQSVVSAAEEAAAAGDYASAERLLREAAVLQEASLGSLHPDLANTLNNLGIVCEITRKPDDAEACFRKAYAIATAALAPDHPFVATSRKNLEDFCAVSGRAVDPPERPAYEASPPVPSARRTSPLLIGALAAGGLVLILISVTWLRSSGAVASPSGTPTVSQETPATKAASPPAAPVAPEALKETAPAKPAPEPAPPLSVAAAQLCTDLSTGASRGDWTCVPAGPPVAPGSLFFYTRLKSPAATTVQHRWYRGDRLHQVVELAIRPNTTEGFRTYSRDTIDNRGPADWRVELRSKTGVLLHEERFAVR